MMKRYFLLVVWLTAALVLTLILDGTVSAGEDLGERLVRQFFANAKSGDLAAIEKTLAQGFQAAHAFGALDRAGELKLARGIKLGSYKLSNFKTTRNGPVIVVTFEVNAPEEVIVGKRVADGSHERLAVWLRTDADWQLIAYANLAPLKK
jgi:hypothetical protein